MSDRLNNMLDADAVAALRQAKEAQRQLRSLGIGVEEEPIKQPIKQPTVEDVVKPQEPVTKIAPDIITPPAAKPATHEKKAHDTFIEVGNLPSKGLFYRNTLMGQPLKVEDLLLIQSIDDFNIQSRFDEIFGRRLRDVLPAEILIADELYISMWLRATSFPGYNFPSDGFVCENEKCDFILEDPDYEIPFNQITWDANVLPDEIMKNYIEKGFVTVTLTSGKTVDIYMGRRFHSAQIADIIKHDFYEKDKNIEIEYLDLLRIASITDIGIADLRERVEEIKTWEILDFLDLVKAVNKYSLIAEPIVNHVCPKCGEVTSLKGYPFRAETYIPYGS